MYLCLRLWSALYRCTSTLHGSWFEVPLYALHCTLVLFVNWYKILFWKVTFIRQINVAGQLHAAQNGHCFSSLYNPITVSLSQSVTSCWINHFSMSFLGSPSLAIFCFPVWRPGCEDATQPAVKARSCHVVSAVPFVLINCWEKCVTSCQADCWCPSGHPSVPGARCCYCGSDGRGGAERRALQDAGQF